ncbi:MAG: SpoIIE family protein phosphatase [Mycobacteriaceae bacterium]
MPDYQTTHREIRQLGALLDELEIGLVSMDTAEDYANVNRSAAALLNTEARDTTASECAGIVRGLADRALNRTESTAATQRMERDPAAELSTTWVFSESPTHLGVMSKPAPYPGLCGRIWTFVDNSPLAQAIDSSKQINALVRASSNAMPDPLVLLEALWRDGRVVDLVYRDVNTATCAYFGLRRAELLGQSIIDDGLVDYYVRCAENGDPVILDDFARERETGLHYYDVRAAQIRPGLISLTWRDVTERFTLARRVAVSEERFRLLAENIGDVVVRLTDGGRITWVSDSVEQALGAPADYWVNRRFTDFGLRGQRTDGRERWAEMVAGKSHIGRGQVRGPDGALHWIHLHSEPFHDADGKRDGLVASFRVIDDEVAVEDRAREEIARGDERNRKLTQYLKAQTRRLMAELNSAARYVASILPDDLDGRVPVTARYLPSEELGGDTYDFRWLDDDHLMVYLVDVSGHGVGPALLAVSVHNLLRSGTIGSETLLRPDAVLTELNRLFQMDRHGGNYFTIWFGVYEASSRTLRYASAGHPPALVLAGGSGPEQLSTDSVPIGMLDDTAFATANYIVPRDAEILLYSDGALELGLPEGKQRPLEEFGNVYACSAGTAEPTLNTLIVRLQEHSAPAKNTDDITFVLLSIP